MLARARARAWASFLAARACLVVADLVLAAARGLALIGLVGSGGLGCALHWSESLTRTAMQVWHAERTRRWRGL